MATVKDALEIARSILGDDIGSQWTDPVLFPKVKQAYGEMIARLNLNGVSTELETTARLTLTEGNTDLGLSFPTDISRLIEVKELATGDPAETAISVTKSDGLPYVTQTGTLRWYTWEKSQLRFVGATVDRDVILRYFKIPTAPTQVNSVLDFQQSEIFLGPRAAALAVITKDPNTYQVANQMAETNLSLLVRAQVKGDQNLPVRRRPFSYTLRRGGRLA